MDKAEVKQEIIGWVKTILVAVVLALCINQFIIVNAQVPTGSMENTIMTDDRIVALRLTYLFSEPQRGDIVVFRFPDDETQKYVKRIIGLPGDTVEIRDGKVYLNGGAEPLEDPYVTKETPEGSWGPYTVPEDCFFMMGDNRNHSIDSRFWDQKFVKKEKILGKVYFSYFPHFSLLK